MRRLHKRGGFLTHGKKWRMPGWLFCILFLPVFAQEQVGVVIEDLDEDAGLYLAGARVGDLLTHWERLPNDANPKGAEGKIVDYFDWWVLEYLQAPRGIVRLFGKRGETPCQFEASNDYWDIIVRPLMSENKLAVFRTGEQQIDAGQVKVGIEAWENLARGPSACWIWLQIANALLTPGQKESDAWTAYDRALGSAESDHQKAIILQEVGYSYEYLENWEKALGAYEEAKDLWRNLNDKDLGVAHVLHGMGAVSGRRGKLVEAEQHFQAALAIQKKYAPNSLSLAGTLNSLGVVASDQGDLAEAERRYQQALAIQEKKAAKSLALASTINHLAINAMERGEFEEAIRRYKQALSIQEVKAPNSLMLADTVSNLGIVAHDRGDLEEAERRYKQALTIEQEKSPGSLNLAITFANLGSIAIDRGDLIEGVRRYNQARVIQEKRAPNSSDLMATLNNLGIVAKRRGNLEQAERFLEQALAIQQRGAPGSMGVARLLNNLGTVASDRGDLTEAMRRYQQALVIKEKHAPNSLDLSATLHNLAIVAELQGDLVAAELSYQKAKVIQEQKAPNSLDLALTLNNLGNLAHEQGDLNEAVRYYKEALTIKEQTSPNNLKLSAIYSNLGLVAWDQGDLPEAERLFLRTLAVQEQKAPYGLGLAATLNGLALIYRGLNKPDSARRFFERSLDVVDSQIGLLGGSQLVKMGFSNRNQDYYLEYLDFLLEQQASERAFEILERSRAKVLRDMMAERDIVLAGDQLPDKLDAERRRLAYFIERTQAELSTSSENEEVLVTELQGYWRQYEEIKRQIRTLSPELASLRYLQVMNLTKTQEILDPGTLLLSFAVMEKQTVVFVVQKNAKIKMITLPEGSRYFQEKIKRWSELTSTQKASEIGQKIFDKTGFELSQCLIEPVRAEIQEAERLLIIPDGPLWYWPFEGLQISQDHGKRCYLIEKKPVTIAVSASLYAEQKKRPKRQISHIVAMGDAVYPAEKTVKNFPPKVDVVAPNTNRPPPLLERIKKFGRIPQTALEIQSIINLYGAAVRSYLREEANEANFKRIPRNVDILHVAAHGLVDDDHPLDSALVLSTNDDFQEGEENGVIFAWEIFENIRLNANLVVLSACDTGLGKVAGGEGLIGLTRAFQFAGARSIIASHWQVADQSTSVLMALFYGYLKEGKPKDEALRQAQIDMIRQPIKVTIPFFFGLLEKTIERDVSHPYYWAAFQLIGPWD